jgi:hypothetical protein
MFKGLRRLCGFGRLPCFQVSQYEMFEDLFNDLSFDLEALDRLILYHADYLHLTGTFRAYERVYFIYL